MNTLYPIFLKLHTIPLLLIGAGKVGCEKLSFLLKNSPDAVVTVIAQQVSDEFWAIAAPYPNVIVYQKAFAPTDLQGHKLIIAATNNYFLNNLLCHLAKQNNLLINVADKPALCDFYLGGIVTKGDLKIAISTNGKSPTVAKRLRQLFEAVLPDTLDELLQNLQTYKQQLTGNFEEKVAILNQLTVLLINKNKQ